MNTIVMTTYLSVGGLHPTTSPRSASAAPAGPFHRESQKLSERRCRTRAADNVRQLTSPTA
eukprot:1375373-Alexandrium_andersonii.AAC.1